jgi:hypothetical protein
MKNTSFHTNDVKKCCEDKLEIDFRKGKEFNGWYYIDNKKAARITIPKGKKPIPPKTYKSMALQLKLNSSQFDDLLTCPLSRQGYDKILKEKQL